MKSRMFCCNRALLRRSLSRSALLWGAYLLLWFVALPGNILSSTYWRGAADMEIMVLNMAAGTCHGVNFIYAALCAWFFFSYQNKSRSANFYGSMPLRRETLFGTQFLAGIMCAVIPNALMAVLTMGAGGLSGANLVAEAGIWFAVQTMTFVFYYGIALICTMIVGNNIAMPVFYVVVNFAAVVLEAVARELMAVLIYGLSPMTEYVLTWLSPLVYFMDHSPGINTNWQGEVLAGYSFYGWKELWIILAIGLAFAVVAFFLHRYRRTEAAEDVIAIHHLKPAFSWVFTGGCALVIGWFLANVLAGSLSNAGFGGITACVVIGAVLGFFLAQMMLEKSLRVFGKRNLLRCGIACVVVFTLALFCYLDGFGVSSYIPREEDVVSVELCNEENAITDRQVISQTLKLHQQILERRRETEDHLRYDVWSPQIHLRYTLAGGKEVCRRFALPVTEETSNDPNSLIRQFDDIHNLPAAILARNLPGDSQMRKIFSAHVYYRVDEKTGVENQIQLNQTQAENLWQAMVTDMKAGDLGQYYYSSDYMAKAVKDQDVSAEFSFTGTENFGRNYYHFNIPESAKHTIAVLKELGVPRETLPTGV